MAVNLTRIYTKTGDDGTTGLADFSRVPKTHARLAAYGDVDEANAVIGTALAFGADDLGEAVRELLLAVQNDLFDVGADLATPVAEDPKHPPLRITEGYVTRLEGWIDEYNEDLEPLRSFILRGGTPGAALLHQACTVVRRAERSTWALLAEEPETTHALPVTYLNRLSDLLFVLARVANRGGDVLWKPQASQELSTDSNIPIDNTNSAALAETLYLQPLDARGHRDETGSDTPLIRTISERQHRLCSRKPLPDLVPAHSSSRPRPAVPATTARTAAAVTATASSSASSRPAPSRPGAPRTPSRSVRRPRPPAAKPHWS
jgi:cob(I)alamin adenosyltransferase